MFIRTDIERIAELFRKKTASEIWITFPDPHPKNGKASKRLTSPHYLDLYRRILQPDGVVHLKTDDENLFDYTLATLKREKYPIHKIIPDLYDNQSPSDASDLQTTYEKRFISDGKTIKYLQFSFGPVLETVLNRQCKFGKQ